MELKIILPILVTALLTILGWFIANWLGASRERKAKRRDKRIDFLIEAYRSLENVSHREFSQENARQLEAALSDIQLFGSDRLVGMARGVAIKFSELKLVDLGELLQESRIELRRELMLEFATQPIFHLRIMEREPQDMSTQTTQTDGRLGND